MKNIVVTGYNGSGASAVRNLLTEYENCDTMNRNSYEHILFYIPNGLFDLENKLLLRNNQSRSDEAITSFRNEMSKLWKNDFNWCGGYKNLYGDKFKEIYEHFINQLIQFRISGYWSYDIKRNKYSIKRIIKDAIKLILSKKIQNFGKINVYDKDNIINCSLVTEEEFLKYAREFVTNYLRMINNSNSEYFVFDHLLKPFDTDKIDKYFDEDFRMIIVERDIRDLYLYGKYIRTSKYPKNPEEFSEFWKRLKIIEKKDNNNKVMRIYLEELIYDYDNTLKKIEEFIGIDSGKHINKNKLFNIEKARENSKFYLKNENWKKEVERFNDELKEYIYEGEE